MAVRLPVALVVWAAAVLAAIALSNSVAGSIHTSSSASSSGSSSASSDPSSMRATDAGSLFGPKALSSALATIRGHLGPDARLSTFVIYPGYVSVTAVRGGTEVDATDYVNGNYSQVSAGDAIGNDPLIPLAKINPRAPAAFIARLSRAAHVPPRTVRYMVAMLDPITHRMSWSAYLVPGSHFEYLTAANGTGQLQALTRGGALRPLRG